MPDRGSSSNTERPGGSHGQFRDLMVALWDVQKEIESAKAHLETLDRRWLELYHRVDDALDGE